MKRLKRIINNRPVAIMVHGKSISELENRIGEFKKFDLCWASINHFRLTETIVEKIGEWLDIIYITSPLRVLQNQYTIREFLDRKANNLWITTHNINYNQEKTLIDDSVSHGNFNTLFCFLFYLAKHNLTKTIVLFGADGAKEKTESPYYKTQEFLLGDLEVSMEDKWEDIYKDTNVANRRFVEFCSYHNVVLPRIINCSKDSHINCFEKVDYDTAISTLFDIEKQRNWWTRGIRFSR